MRKKLFKILLESLIVKPEGLADGNGLNTIIAQLTMTNQKTITGGYKHVKPRVWFSLLLIFFF